MKKLILLLSIVIFLSSCSKKNKTIEVIGTGLIFKKADYVLLDYSIVTLDINPKKSQDSNILISKNLIKKLKEIGLAEKNIFSTDYSIKPQYNYKQIEGSVLVGFRAENEMSVKITNINDFKNIIIKIFDVGVNNIKSIDFGINNYDDFKNEALLKAVKNAKSKAQKMCATLGKKIGEPINIQEITEPENHYGQKNYNKRLMSMSVMDDDEGNVISSGDREVKKKVKITFEIK